MHRDQQATCSLVFHRPDDPLDHCKTAAFPNGSIPRLDLPVPALDFELIAPKLRAFIADDVLSFAFRLGDRPANYCSDGKRSRLV
jgi:hypothetical protein